MVCYARMLILLCLSCVVPFFYSSKAYAEELFHETNTAQLYVNKWEQGISALNLVRFSSSFTDWAVYRDGTRTHDNRLYMDWIIDFTDKRFWKGAIKQDRVTDSEKYDSEVIVVDEKILVVSKYFLDNQVEFGVVSRVNANNGLWDSSLGLLYWGYPFGYVESGNTRIFLPDVLKSAKLEISNEHGRLILRGTTADFVITAEFNSEECQYIKYLELKRITRVNDPFVFQECSFVVNRVEECNGLWLPVDYHVEEKKNGGKRHFINAPHEIAVVEDAILPRTLKADVKLERVVLPTNISKEDFKITISVPNYTPVFMEDAPQIKYVWLEGKIVPLTDKLALAQARGHGFIPGPTEPRFWFMAIGILLMLIGGGRILYKYIMVKGGKT